jgi:hypothetical protein
MTDDERLIEARIDFKRWRDVFLSALQGAAGVGDKTIASIIEDAAAIADAAVLAIGKRVPK